MNKVVRLPDGRFITRKIVESDPVALANAKPEEIWTMADGKSNSGKTVYTRQILVRDMETRHLINALKKVATRTAIKACDLGYTGEAAEKFCLELEPVQKTLRDELDIRLGKKQREKTTEDQQTKRCFNFE